MTTSRANAADALPKFWFPHSPEGYAVGEVLQHDSEGDRMQVKLHVSASEVKVMAFPGSLAKPMNPENLNGVDDNTQLMHLHEPSLLFNLRHRYAKDLIYTYTGYILIAVNPYKKLACYGAEVMKAYRGKSIGLLPPHLYAMADRAFRSMKAGPERAPSSLSPPLLATLPAACPQVDGTSQSIMISGESGSGKTESAKIVMKYLAMRASDLLSSLSEKVLECNPILETFGNAKTVMNHNSSRFGKFTRIHFDARNWLVGADVVTYLLEKSRTVVQSPLERNYHAFYQLFAGLTAADKAELSLAAPQDYAYLSAGVIEVSAIDDKTAYADMCAAMRTIGISGEQQRGINALLAALLHLGNIGFDSTDDAESCAVSAPDAVNATARLMQLPPAALEEALTSRTMKSLSGSVYKIPLKAQEANYSRDTLAKAIYAKLFDWLVRAVNQSLLTQADTRAFIGVLDIFGFEQFETNSFEQLCINFANEMLQSHFNTCIFRQEQEIYLREAIVWDPIDEPNNQACIAMLSARPPDTPVGLFALLDEQCKLPKTTHRTFVEKLFEQHAAAVRESVLAAVGRGANMLANEGFVVRHYAGQVTYTADGFLAKNNNSLHADLEQVLKQAAAPLLAEIVAEADQSARASVAAKPGRASRAGKGSSGARFSSVSAHFSGQLTSLLTNLRETNSTFVRCINPNTEKQPSAFAGGHALRLMHEGFPTRCPYDSLYERYKDVMPKSIAMLDSPSFCEILLLALGLDKSDYQLGITKVFFRAGKLAFLDDLTGSDYKELAPDIANKVRRWLIKKRWRRHTIAVVAVGRMVRFLAELRLLRRLVTACRFMLLMATAPKLSVRRAREIRRRNAAIRLQSRGRALVAMTRFHRFHWATYFSSAGGANAAKYAAKSRPRPAEVANGVSGAGGGSGSAGVGGGIVMSAELDARLAKLEAAAEQVPALAEKVAALEEALAASRKQVDDLLAGGGSRTPRDASGRPRSSVATSAASTKAALAQAVSRQQARGSTSGKASWRESWGGASWGFLDLLGITQGAASSAPTAGAVARKAGGGARQPVASMMAPPSDALTVLQAAIAAIGTHFAQAAVAGSGKTLELLGNDQKNKEIAVLVRGQLCTALSRDFVQHACEATHERVKRGGGGYTPAEKSLTATVVEVNSTGLEGPAANPNIKFRSFVCCGLNHAQLHDWVAVLTTDPETMGKFYEAWAYVRSSEQALPQMMEALRPLAGYKFALSLDYETSRWDLH
ncbi:hypothetical protein EMIHUDRAFT_448407 [Emiliania huxleyi CCMP1516]|uniref:Myosin motor domain-containing protein n=2 Tax=Emiliania huxleyi TaxID=2903 RepID=A0A0D3IE80_EMIH1|nr:hypothetical protein EMIHUDRAFT_448407 [Emiliania huxleyi CCMP1516]EOD09565.1 hypothetical protein EMIHUDRAFT_448407 [Emiliania huxleyi CCMP1516]|eukprot:XP_005761994.1 hypothetical protein EMIHUDRAFT_448407 [Emiliania huxleyi CCMP1516]